MIWWNFVGQRRLDQDLDLDNIAYEVLDLLLYWPMGVVVVDARGDMTACVFGDMMSTYFKGRSGAGMVIDGVLRDYPNLKKLHLPLWVRGWTPNFHTRTGRCPSPSMCRSP